MATPTYLILGSTDGIGSVLCERLAKRGASLVLGGRDPQKLNALAASSSAAARTGMVNHEAIAAAKAGVEGLTRSAAASYAAHNVRVNCVAPGLVRTPLTKRLMETPSSLAVSEAIHPLGRIGEPEDVASAIEWLLEPGNTWVTGQVIGVDGGLATLRGKARA